MMQAAMEKDEKPPKYRCILWGGYAWGNVGDELALAVAIHDMRLLYGDSLAILTRSPGYTRRLFPDCDVILYEPAPPNDPARDYDVDEQLLSTDWAKQIAASEMLYLAGGGYLSDLFFVNWTLLPALVALRCEVRIATAPIGLGPFSSDWWMKRVAAVLQKATVIVRDDASAEYCRQHRVKAEYRDDDGFRLAEVLSIVRSDRTTESRDKRIGVNIFYQHGSSRQKDSTTWWTAFLKHLSERNANIKGFCFHNSVFEDYAHTCECFDRSGLNSNDVIVPDVDFRATCARLSHFDAIISSRFHAIVVGNTIGISTFAVCDGEYYDRKMEAATMNFERSTLIKQFDCAPDQVAVDIVHDRHAPPCKVEAA